VNKEFSHSVVQVDESFDWSFDVEASDNAKIKMSIFEEGFWLSANREGCLHLARFFAELGLRNHEDGYHVHMNEFFRTSGQPPEFSFERLDNWDAN
jgi:hypothetical protein